jgi:hypothetical protein
MLPVRAEAVKNTRSVAEHDRRWPAGLLMVETDVAVIASWAPIQEIKDQWGQSNEGVGFAIRDKFEFVPLQSINQMLIINPCTGASGF